jgi:antitoxin VapB
MTQRAKLFRNGGSQAVRLPRDCRFEGQDDVLVRREGRTVVLEPVDEWPAAFPKVLGAWDEPIERPDVMPLGKARDPLGPAGRRFALWVTASGTLLLLASVLALVFPEAVLEVWGFGPPWYDWEQFLRVSRVLCWSVLGIGLLGLGVITGGLGLLRRSKTAPA